MTNINKTDRLNEFIKNPQKALLTLSLPMMVGMSVQAIYMLIDTAFIGNWVGGSALAGLGIVFPPMFIIMGITFGLGSGATTTISQFIRLAVFMLIRYAEILNTQPIKYKT